MRSIEHRHRQRRLLAAAAAVVLLLSAGTVAWVARSGGEDVTAGGVQEEVVVSCASGAPTFPIGALATLGDAPPPDEAMTAALRTFLSTEEGQSWPQAGWRVLTVDDSRAVLVAEAGSTVAFQTLEREGGAWDWAGSSQPDDGCPLKVVPPDGHNLVEWRLDPDGPGETQSSVIH